MELRFVACSAAIELDNIALGRGTKTVALKLLIDVLEGGIPAIEERTSPMSVVTPMVGIMDRVVRGLRPDAVLDDVVACYDSFVSRLKAVVAQVGCSALREDELESVGELRETCLAVFRFASYL